MLRIAKYLTSSAFASKTACTPIAMFSITKTITEAPGGPKAVGPYSFGTVVSSGAKMFYSSGQVSIDPQTNQFVHRDCVVKQTEQVLQNLDAALKAAGTDRTNVIKCNVYLEDMSNIAKMNEVYGKFFSQENKPGRTCVAVKGLPLNALVEIECIAVIP